jgi:hypothetical protein
MRSLGGNPERGRARCLPPPQPNLDHLGVAEILQAQSPFGHPVRTDQPEAVEPGDQRRVPVRGQPVGRGPKVDLPRVRGPEGGSPGRLPAPGQLARALEPVEKAIPATDVPAKRRLRDRGDRIGQLDRPPGLARRAGEQAELRRIPTDASASVVKSNAVPASRRNERGDVELATGGELERDRRSRLRPPPRQCDHTVAAQKHTIKHRSAHTHEPLPAALPADRDFERRRSLVSPSRPRTLPHRHLRRILVG